MVGNFLIWTFLLIIIESKLCERTKSGVHDASKVDSEKEKET